MNHISISQIEKSYRSKGAIYDVLKGISLSFKKGDSVAIVGPSGSGKSTLLLILGCLLLPNRGSVTFDDVEITKLSQSSLDMFRRDKIGTVFQEHNLLSHLNVVDNIALGLRIQNRSSKKDAREKSMKLLQKMGLEKKSFQMPSCLSGGEKQRISILRALIKKPCLLLLDEPTSDIDRKTAEIVLNEILTFHNLHKPILIISTHDENVLSCVSRQIYLKNGEIQL